MDILEYKERNVRTGLTQSAHEVDLDVLDSKGDDLKQRKCAGSPSHEKHTHSKGKLGLWCMVEQYCGQQGLVAKPATRLTENECCNF